MPENIKPIRDGVRQDHTKQTLLSDVAEAYDILAAYAPDSSVCGIVFAVVNETGDVQHGYHIIGNQDRNSLYVSRCTQSIASAANAWSSE